MDNLCHALAGAACAEAGLKRLTPWATGGLVISANIPDIDFMALLGDTPFVFYRRGWSHGILALILLPLLLTISIRAADRFWAARTGREPRVRFRPMLALTFLGVLSHLFLDYLNAYGIRLLTPLSDRWFYGDALFVVDPWLWLILGAGVVLARRRRSPVPAAAALGIATFYTVAMLALSSAGQAVVLRAWHDAHGTAPQGLMVGPAPLNPLRHAVILDAGDRYVLGELQWWPRRLRLPQETLLKNDQAPPVVLARQHPHIRAVLVWARFPHYAIAETDAGVRVSVQDLRYGPWLGAASVTVQP
jgi:inner membrane protein